MRQVKIVLMLLLITILSVSCINGPESNGAASIGFSINSFGEEEGDSTVLVSVAWIDLLNPQPTVTINGKDPDKDNSAPYYFRFSGIPAGAKFEYIISFDNTVIRDSVYVPKALDSVWCNGVIVNQSDTTVTIDRSDKYTFRWKANDEYENQGYTVDYYAYGLLSEYVSRKYTEGDSVVIVPSLPAPEYSASITLAVKQRGTVPFYNGQMPTKEVQDLFVYYDIEGPEAKIEVMVMMDSF